MGKFTFILGGARSGKSSHALRLAEDSGKLVTFIATAQAFDDEMSARIEKHKTERPSNWQTLEIPFEIARHKQEIQHQVVILDCMTLLVSNLLMQYVNGEEVDEPAFVEAIEGEVSSLLETIKTGKDDWIIVSNEVGLGLVPPHLLGRVYRDGLGRANQRLASEADEVLWMAAGIPVPIHGFRANRI